MLRSAGSRARADGLSTSITAQTPQPRKRRSRHGAPGEYVDYAAAKSALDTPSIGLAREAGPEGVRVDAARPGVVATDRHASGGEPDRAERIGATAPLGRAGTADEAAESIVQLLSDAATYVTGSIPDMAGGR